MTSSTLALPQKSYIQQGILCAKDFYRMSPRVITISSLSALLLSIPCAAAAADHFGWYGGTGAGYARIKSIIGSDSASNHRYLGAMHGVGFKFFGGYRFDSPWAIEAQYINHEKYKLLGGPNTSDNVHAAAKVSSFAVNGVGNWPLSKNLSLIGKVGVIYGPLKGKSHAKSFGQSYFSSKVAPLVDIDAEYKFNSYVSLRAEYEFYGTPTVFRSGASGARFRSEMLSGNLLYRFY